LKEEIEGDNIVRLVCKPFLNTGTIFAILRLFGTDISCSISMDVVEKR
jgi:hypothetical protein